MKNYIVAIDGPAASGKSTTARLVAQQLGWIYVDTGAMYRAVTLDVLRKGVSVDDAEGVARVSADCRIAFEASDNGQHVLLNGEDVSTAIRSPEVNSAVSRVSSYGSVRERMVNMQRAFAFKGSLVMDGRDIATVVFPNADVKVFLSASLDVRAQRRQSELEQNGTRVDLETLRSEIAVRDKADEAREHSPLRKASDAVELDTTSLTIDEQVGFILNLVRTVIGNATQA